MRTRWVLVVAAAVLAGCAYKAASSSDTSREIRDRSRVGCLEIGVDRRTDLGNSAIVRYAFENHCAQPTSVDIGWATVIGRTAEGNELALMPARIDGSVTIEPHGAGETTLAYPAPTPIGQLCVDINSLVQKTPAVWRCFGNPEAVARL